LTRTEIADLIDRLGDLVATLRQADRHDKAEENRHLGLYLSFDPNRQIVRAEARAGSWRRERVRVGGRRRPGWMRPRLDRVDRDPSGVVGHGDVGRLELVRRRRGQRGVRAVRHRVRVVVGRDGDVTSNLAASLVLRSL